MRIGNNNYKTTSQRSGGYKNDLEALLTGHLKNRYGVEGMDITGRNGDYKKIVPVSDEMKQHVLEDVKKGYYKYNGMSGDNEAEWDAYYRKNNEYLKTLKKEDRLSANWTLNQLHLEIGRAVSNAIKEKIPNWTHGDPVSHKLLDEIFADEKITSLVGGKSDTSKSSGQDSIEISPEYKLWLEENDKQAQEIPEEVSETSEEVSETPEEAPEISEKEGGKVAVNVGKRMRQIAAAADRNQLQQVMNLLKEDMADCKAGLEKGWCDESEIAKVESLIARAKEKMSQVPQTSDNENTGGLDAFAIASLM